MRTRLVGWCIAGWKRLLGCFIDRCALVRNISASARSQSSSSDPAWLPRWRRTRKNVVPGALAFGAIDEIRESLGLYPKSINHEAGRRDSRLRG